MGITQLSMDGKHDKPLPQTIMAPRRNGQDARLAHLTVAMPAEQARFVLDQSRVYGWSPDTVIAWCISYAMANTAWHKWAVYPDRSSNG